jgi:hypothetical protein
MKVKTDLVLIALAVFYIVLTFPLGLMALTAVVSGAVYTVYSSPRYVLAVLIIMIVARFLTVLLRPQPLANLPGFASLRDGFQNLNENKEGFQPKDPVNVHQRIATEKLSGPLQPKMDDITGVLESVKILDSLQIANLNKAETGGPSRTQPASLNGIPPIRTPREEEIVRNTFKDLAPRGNPFLQNGADDSSVNTALSSRGADLKMEQGAGDVPGTNVGPGSV